MKKDSNKESGNVENQPKKRPAKTKAKREKKQSESIRLPFLLEFTYTLSTLILILLALVIMVTSFLAGASLLTMMVRTGVATFVVGTLLMLISSQISSGLLFSVKVEQEEEQRKQEEALSSVSTEDHGVTEA